MSAVLKQRRDQPWFFISLWVFKHLSYWRTYLCPSGIYIELVLKSIFRMTWQILLQSCKVNMEERFTLKFCDFWNPLFGHVGDKYTIKTKINNKTKKHKLYLAYPVQDSPLCYSHLYLLSVLGNKGVGTEICLHLLLATFSVLGRHNSARNKDSLL